MDQSIASTHPADGLSLENFEVFISVDLSPVCDEGAGAQYRNSWAHTSHLWRGNGEWSHGSRRLASSHKLWIRHFAGADHVCPRNGVHGGYTSKAIPNAATLFYFLVGAGPIVWTITPTTLHQTVTPEALFGRVKSLLLMIDMGGARSFIGSLAKWHIGRDGLPCRSARWVRHSSAYSVGVSH